MQLAQVQGSLVIRDHAAMDTTVAEDFAAGVDVWGDLLICGNVGGLDCQ